MHLYLWNAKGSEVYSLFPQLRDKGIPLTAKPVGFQRFDGSWCGYQSLSLLQMDPVVVWASSLPNPCHRPL